MREGLALANNFRLCAMNHRTGDDSYQKLEPRKLTGRSATGGVGMAGVTHGLAAIIAIIHRVNVVAGIHGREGDVERTPSRLA